MQEETRWVTYIHSYFWVSVLIFSALYFIQIHKFYFIIHTRHSACLSAQSSVRLSYINSFIFLSLNSENEHISFILWLYGCCVYISRKWDLFLNLCDSHKNVTTETCLKYSYNMMELFTSCMSFTKHQKIINQNFYFQATQRPTDFST